MKLLSRSALSTIGMAGLLATVAILGPQPKPEPLAAAPAPATLNPLERVPGDAGLFAHLNVAAVWDHPATLEIRKAYGKELDTALARLEKETGLRPEQVNTITFHFPKIPSGPGDESLFVLQITTKKPYDRSKILAGLRGKGEDGKGDVVKLRERMVLHLTSETQFTVLHETLLEDFQNGKPTTIAGLMSEALTAAKSGKHTLVAGIDPSQLPNEIFTSAPPELQPFLPLLKSQSIVLQANLDKELAAELRFLSDKEDQAIDAERSFNLLMKLADDGLSTVLKNEKTPEDFKPLIPALTELQKTVQKVKAERKGTEVRAKASISADPALAKPIVAAFLRVGGGSARAQSSNNLKQIGLALHNYHDMNGVFPPAAIVDKKGKALLSWRVAILPYVEQNNLYQQFKLDEPWDSDHNKKLIDKMPKVYALPYSEGKRGETNYRVFVGNGAVFDMIQGIKITQITDGTSNTLLAFEAAESTPWTKPDETEFDPQKPMLKHLRFEDNKASMILMADGSVRAIPNTLPEATLKLLIQRDDGMPIPDFE